MQYQITKLTLKPGSLGAVPQTQAIAIAQSKHDTCAAEVVSHKLIPPTIL